MNDLMLYARLKDLAMPADQAWNLTAQIRDTLHPIAHTAAIKIANAITGSGPGQRGMRGLGDSTSLAIQGGSAVAGAAAGAAYGSVVPGIGTAVGAVVGFVASMLVHTSQGPQRAAQARAIDQALSTIPSAYVGRQIPWNGSATSPGLLQFISALMTGGLFMSWDNAVTNTPSVNGNWSTTFVNAIKALVAAIVNNPPGAQVTVSIPESPGAGGISPLSFSFVNPGIAVGPDAIAANVVMGPNGLMYQMIKHLGETDAHASANASNGAAQKVFALMIDKATADLAPPSTLSTQLANAPIVNVPSAIATAATSLANSALTGVGGGCPGGNCSMGQAQVPQISTQPGGPAVAQITTPAPLNNDNVNMAATPTGITGPITQALSPVQDTSAALLQLLLAQQGANMTSPKATQLLADIAANGVAQTPQGPSSMPSWLLPVGIAGAALLAILFIAKKR
jgi:hypothetical protein